MKVLYVTKPLNQKTSDGGLEVSKRNLNFLFALYGETNVIIFEVPHPNVLHKLLNMLSKRGYGVTNKITKKFKKIISCNFDFIFFNGSLYGSLVKIAYLENVKSLVFFHNVEKKYYHDRFKIHKNLATFLYYLYMSRNELSSVKYGKFLCAISHRDARDILSIYDKKVDFILPITMEQKKLNQSVVTHDKVVCLFVGSNFFPNQQGMDWFIEKVLPKVDIKLIIVGSICNYLKPRYGLNEKIDYKGYIDDLSKVYAESNCVVSPIFYGSGMKTKTIEAFAYGKTFIGTDESFAGIECSYKDVGAKCNTVQEFVNQISLIDHKKSFNANSYNLFMQNFDSCNKLKEFSSFLISKKLL